MVVSENFPLVRMTEPSIRTSRHSLSLSVVETDSISLDRRVFNWDDSVCATALWIDHHPENGASQIAISIDIIRRHLRNGLVMIPAFVTSPFTRFQKHHRAQFRVIIRSERAKTRTSELYGFDLFFSTEKYRLRVRLFVLFGVEHSR